MKLSRLMRAAGATSTEETNDLFKIFPLRTIQNLDTLEENLTNQEYAVKMVKFKYIVGDFHSRF